MLGEENELQITLWRIQSEINGYLGIPHSSMKRIELSHIFVAEKAYHPKYEVASPTCHTPQVYCDILSDIIASCKDLIVTYSIFRRRP
jgi:hypothetical protein